MSAFTKLNYQVHFLRGVDLLFEPFPVLAELGLQMICYRKGPQTPRYSDTIRRYIYASVCLCMALDSAQDGWIM